MPEFDEVVFHHPDVVRLAENDFTMIKIDVTKGGDPLHEMLLRRYDVKGVPTIVFLDASGKERTDLRLVDFIPPGEFLGHMADAKNPNPGQEGKTALN